MSSTLRTSPVIEIDAGHEINAVAFSANGEYLVSGGFENVRVWRVQGGTRIATLDARAVCCLVVSPDGKFIAAGTSYGEVLVWDTRTYNQVFAHKEDSHAITGVDFSPDSTRLVAASWSGKATVWDIAARKRVFTLDHDDWVTAVKYSPRGGRIATATDKSVRVWNSNSGGLLVKAQVEVTARYNTGLLWSNNHLFVISERSIKEINVFNWSAVSEWPVSDPSSTSCIALPQAGKFIAYSTRHAITFWDTSTHTQLCDVRQYRDVRSVALSLDGQLLAVVTRDGKVFIDHLFHINETDSVSPSLLHPTLQEPEFRIEQDALRLWENGRLENAEALLTAAISGPQTQAGQDPYVLASRALVRTRLRQWDAAVVDAEESIKIMPTVLGCVAKCVALVSKGSKQEGLRACDIAFEHFHSTHVTILLLVKAIVLFMAGEHDDAISRMDNLIDAVQFNSTFYVVQAYMHFLLGDAHLNNSEYERAIRAFGHASMQLRRREARPPLVVSLISGWKFDDLWIKIQQRLCEALFASGRVKEASETILCTLDTFSAEVYMRSTMHEWFTDFIQRCLSTPEKSDDATKRVYQDDMLSFHPPLVLSSPTLLLRAWAGLKLKKTSWSDALEATDAFLSSKFIIYQVLCECLETGGHVTDAVACFHQMNNNLALEMEYGDADWIREFKSRCMEKLQERAEIAMNARRYDGAVSFYVAALSLKPAGPQGLLVMRSRAYVECGMWANALDDANEVIKLDPSSPLGYERKHAALHGSKHFEDAIDALEMMLSKMSPPSDERSLRYVNPAQTKETIRNAIQDVIRESPLVLIDTHSGRLLDKSCQASSFESQPIFQELISSMTTDIDHARIESEVAQYYHYAMFSHKWEHNEPSYDQVVKVVVYDLEKSPTHEKLQMFCKLAREAGLNWAWSDTCCIDKSNHFVLQEALVSMFRWYEGSSVTLVFLRGVHGLSQRGALAGNIWNRRAWTLQEYHASKVVRFYNEDWTTYMGLDIGNHKDSPEIIAEMEEATGVSAKALMALRPGLDDIREKLRLASTRETMRVEDAAYSLLGIFSISMPVVYGEGDQALGRLLAQLLTSSGDTSILAWTGRSGSFNSCLPASITVFSQSPSSHIPAPMTNNQLEMMAVVLRDALVDTTSVTELYEKLYELTVPSFSGQRMRLPCLTFKLGPISAVQEGSTRVFRAQTTALGAVKIRTDEDLSRLGSLYLIHPWIDFLLDRYPVEGTKKSGAGRYSNYTSPVLGGSPLSESPYGIFPSIAPPELPSLNAFLSRPLGRRFMASAQDLRSSQPPSGSSTQYTPSLQAPSSVSEMEKEMRALRLVARLRQPFGALLLTPTRQNAEEYRRVAVGGLITVQVKEMAPSILDKLVRSVRVLDVL